MPILSGKIFRRKYPKKCQILRKQHLSFIHSIIIKDKRVFQYETSLKVHFVSAILYNLIVIQIVII